MWKGRRSQGSQTPVSVVKAKGGRDQGSQVPVIIHILSFNMIFLDHKYRIHTAHGSLCQSLSQLSDARGVCALRSSSSYFYSPKKKNWELDFWAYQKLWGHSYLTCLYLLLASTRGNFSCFLIIRSTLSAILFTAMSSDFRPPRSFTKSALS